MGGPALGGGGGHGEGGVAESVGPLSCFLLPPPPSPSRSLVVAPPLRRSSTGHIVK